MKEQFIKFMEVHPKHHKDSTINGYVGALEKIRNDEDCPWQELADNIEKYVRLYDTTGKKGEIGTKNHNYIISALKKFREFVRDTQK